MNEPNKITEDSLDETKESNQLLWEVESGLQPVFTIEDDENLKVLSLHPKTMQIIWKKIDAFIKRDGEPFLYEIKTRTGKKVTTTGCHPVMIFKDGKIVSEIVNNLNIGERIATPRELKIEEKETTLPKTKNIKESD